MKFRLTILALTLLCLQAFSQSKNTITLIYGTGISVMNIHGVIGDFGYTEKRENLLGLGYERYFTQSFSIQTGLTFSNNKVQLDSSLPHGGTPVVIPEDELKLISVPVLAKLTFLKFLFIDGGAIIDFETNTPNNSTTNKQSGIGYELGLGVQCTLSHIHLFINPYAQEHSVIPFSSSQYKSNFNLIDAGYKFGVGYSF